MPLRNCPLTSIYEGSLPRIILPIRIINPHNNKHYKTRGIIDTGADDCSIPAGIAKILGHILKSGIVDIAGTAGGDCVTYKHTTTIEVLHPDTDEVIYSMENVLIDYMPKLQEVLLGVSGFLEKFILEINYPNNVFSLRLPK